MRVNRLLPLVIVLLVLIVAVVVFKRSPAPTQLADEVGFERLVPDTLTVDAVQGVDLYQGEKADSAVRLRRHDDAWVTTSYHDAPAKKDKITQLLDRVSGLEGELRSEQADFLDDFRLEDGQALHLLLYTTDMNKPAVHLLAAQGQGQDGFVRVADDPKIYHVNLNLYSEAGLYGAEAEKGPEAKPWLDLQLQDIPQDQITAVELDTPWRRFELVKEKPEAAPTEDKPGAEAKAAAEPQPAAEAKWILVEPKVDEALKQGVVDGLVSTLGTLRGDDVAALDKVADYGLDDPPYRALLTVQEKGKDAHQVTIAVGREVPQQEGQRYVRVGREGPVYILPQWTFEQIFPTLGTLVTLDMLSVQPDEVASLDWQQDGKTWTVARRAGQAAPPAGDKAPGAEAPKPADTWHRVQGDGAVVDAATVEAVLNMAKNLTANDWFAEPPEATGLEAPVLSLSLGLKDGTTRRLQFGKTHGEDEDRYARLEDGSGVFVVANATYSSLTESLGKLRPETTSAAPSSTSPGPQPAMAPVAGSPATPAQAPAAPSPAGSAPSSAESAKP